MRRLDRLASLFRDRKGGTAIEYGLIISLVVITMVVGFIQVANTTTTLWGNVNTKIGNATGN